MKQPHFWNLAHRILALLSLSFVIIGPYPQGSDRLIALLKGKNGSRKGFSGNVFCFVLVNKKQDRYSKMRRAHQKLIECTFTIIFIFQINFIFSSVCITFKSTMLHIGRDAHTKGIYKFTQFVCRNSHPHS